jgi:peptide/nickel transport system permease protein
VGRAILGAFANQQSVDNLNHELGLDGPLVSRYFRWFGNAVQGDFGTSYKFKAPVVDYVSTALWASLKLALVTIVIVVPLGIIGGTVAALRKGKATDRIITVAGLSLAVTPEFVVGIVLIVVVAVKLGWLPPGGSAKGSVVEQLKVLILPALTLTAVLFGYLARMTRAGTIEALAADYTRTATLKGLPRSVVLRRHVLRNSLLPTISVTAVQISYLLGGLLVTETMFNYRGLGLLVADAARGRDIPMLMGSVFIVGAIAMTLNLVADILIAWLNPRVRYGSKS